MSLIDDQWVENSPVSRRRAANGCVGGQYSPTELENLGIFPTGVFLVHHLRAALRLLWAAMNRAFGAELNGYGIGDTTPNPA